MDRDTRNATIRALAAASAAAIRMSPARALAAVSGEFTAHAAPTPSIPPPLYRDRPMPIERTPNRYTGGAR